MVKLIIFMNYKSQEGKDRERGNLKGSRAINPHAGKNTEYNKENTSTYNLFPGDRLVHYDFLTGIVPPNSEKPVGEKYPTLQVHFFEKINNNGIITENVPYFSVYPSSDLWMDIIKVE